METTAPPNEGNPRPGFGALPSGDKVKAALTEAGATDAQVDSVLWLISYGRAASIGTLSGLARRLNVDAGTLSKIFSGKYPADLSRMIGKIDHFRQVESERRSLGDQVVVRDLRVVKDISDFADLTRITAQMTLLFGPNQSGKSWALSRIYAPSNNHGRTVYTSLLRSGGATKLWLSDVMKACGISERKSYGEMKERAYRYFDPQTLLIVDEFHQTLVGRTLKMTTIEAIRSIHEECGCGVLLCGTDILPEMFDDPRFKKFLGQTSNRGVLRRLIPAKPYPEDVVAICRGYGFAWPPAKDDDARAQVNQIASDNGIGKLCKFFQVSRRLAHKRGEKLDWHHFTETTATLKSWAKGEQMKRA